MPGRTLLLSIWTLFLCASFAFADDSVTITTYYPAPYGVYKEMRLYPNTSPNTCDAANEGAMYYDNTSSSNQVLVCRQTGFSTYAWESFGGVPSGMIAMFDAACPTGWSRFSALDSKVPMGAAAYGSSGGSSTHTHTMSLQAPWGPLAGFSTNCGSAPCGSGTGLAMFGAVSVYVLPQIASTESSLPSYLTVVWCKKD